MAWNWLMCAHGLVVGKHFLLKIRWPSTHELFEKYSFKRPSWPLCWISGILLMLPHDSILLWWILTAVIFCLSSIQSGSSSATLWCQIWEWCENGMPLSSRFTVKFDPFKYLMEKNELRFARGKRGLQAPQRARRPHAAKQRLQGESQAAAGGITNGTFCNSSHQSKAQGCRKLHLYHWLWREWLQVYYFGSCRLVTT